MLSPGVAEEKTVPARLIRSTQVLCAPDRRRPESGDLGSRSPDDDAGADQQHPLSRFERTVLRVGDRHVVRAIV